jgi:hypothetical protein
MFFFFPIFPSFLYFNSYRLDSSRPTDSSEQDTKPFDKAFRFIRVRENNIQKLFIHSKRALCHGLNYFVGYFTTNGYGFMIESVLTTIFYLPGVVRVPTCHVHAQCPVEPATLGVSPLAVLRPIL